MSASRVSPTPGDIPLAGRPSVIHSAATLTPFVARLLEATGVSAASARLVADSLVVANLRGVDSHGVQLVTSYLRQLRAGGLHPTATGRIASESGACLTYDSENGLGQVTAERCVTEALRLVKSSGLAMVVARNANHFGAAAYWSEKIVAAGYLGVVMCNACPAVPPWQGQAPHFGTNPFCAGVPTEGPFPWTLDMATTTVALGKLSDAAFRGVSHIPGWWGFLDAAGQPTEDPRAAQAGRPTPFGRYKGSGLAMLVEMLTAGLSGGPMATQIPAFGQGEHPLQISHSFLVIDPGRFADAAPFAGRMGELVGRVKSSPPAPGYEEVLVAGEPEWRTSQVRSRDGIPLPAALWDQLIAVARELHVSSP